METWARRGMLLSGACCTHPCIWTNPDEARQLRRGAPRRRAPGYFPHKIPTIIGFLVENDLQLGARQAF